MLQLTIVCRGWCTAKPLASVLQHASSQAPRDYTHTCIAPHGLYRSGEYDDEASELRHRRERLLALRRKREGAAAAADGA